MAGLPGDLFRYRRRGDVGTVLSNVRRKLDTFDAGRIEKMLADYGSTRTRRVFRQLKSGVHA